MPANRIKFSLVRLRRSITSQKKKRPARLWELNIILRMKGGEEGPVGSEGTYEMQQQNW